MPAGRANRKAYEKAQKVLRTGELDDARGSVATHVSRILQQSKPMTSNKITSKPNKSIAEVADTVAITVNQISGDVFMGPVHFDKHSPVKLLKDRLVSHGPKVDSGLLKVVLLHGDCKMRDEFSFSEVKCGDEVSLVVIFSVEEGPSDDERLMLYTRNVANWPTMCRFDKPMNLRLACERGIALEHMEPKFKADPEVVLAAVRQNGLALRYACGDCKKSLDVALAAVQQNGLALQDVDHALLAHSAILSTAVCQDPCALKYVPEKSNSKDVVMLAINHARWRSDLLNFAGRFRVDIDVAIAAIRRNIEAMNHISNQLVWNEEVLIAAIQHGWKIGDWPSALKSNKDFVVAVVSHDGMLLRHAHNSLKADVDVVLRALHQNAHALRYAASKLQSDKEFLMAAVSRNSDVLLHVSKKLMCDADLLAAAASRLETDKEFLTAAVSRNSNVLLHVSQEPMCDPDLLAAASEGQEQELV